MSKQVVENYARVIYLYYTMNNKVVDITDYPDYIAEEIDLGFSVPFIKKMKRDGYLAYDEAFVVTEKGKKLLEESDEAIYFFTLNSPYIKVEEFYETEGTFDERAIKLFTKKLEEFRTKKKYVEVESMHIELAKLDKENALYHYLANLCYAISGIKEYSFIRKFRNKKITRKELVEKYKDCVYVNPQVILGIEEHKDEFTDDMVDLVYDTEKLGYTLCSRERFLELVREIMAGEYNNASWQEVITDIFMKRMKFKVPSEKKIEKEDLGEKEKEESQIIGEDETQDTVSDAKQEEIAENESKKQA
ncbi:MAG: hypothetical protein MJ146_04580 [Clostridia bacterium]|nr:hypothetical protein [Clostridia bacterium]